MTPGRAADRDRLERWARGELSTEEEAALLAEAKRDPELAGELDLFRPYSERELAPLDTAFARSSERRSRPLPRRRPRPRVARPVAALAAALSVAAAFVVGLVSRRAADPDALAPYTLAVEGGAARGLRGAADDEHAPVIEWALDAPVTLILRPDTAVAGPLEVRAFVRGDGAWRPRPLEAHPAGQGAFEARAQVRALFEDPGTFDLMLLVARPGLDVSPERAERAKGAQVVRRRVRVTGGAEASRAPPR